MSVLQRVLTTLVLTLFPLILSTDVLVQLASSSNTASLSNPLHRGHHQIKFLDFTTYLGNGILCSLSSRKLQTSSPVGDTKANISGAFRKD